MKCNLTKKYTIFVILNNKVNKFLNTPHLSSICFLKKQLKMRVFAKRFANFYVFVIVVKVKVLAPHKTSTSR